MTTLYKIPSLFFICLTAIAFTACEKVIDLKLDNTTPKLVIEANFTDSLQIQTVTVSQTINFEQSNNMQPVSGAAITLTDKQNLNISFVEKTPGIYQTTTPVKGLPGQQYFISVDIKNKNYAAVSVMPQLVKIDTITQTDLVILGKTNKTINVKYQDPAGLGNYYNSRIYVNGTKRKEFYVDFDRFNDGKPVSNLIFVNEPKFMSGDKVKVDFLCIDVNVYKYLFAITQIGGNGGPPTAPANPDSNFSNGALGYFSACTLYTDSLIIK
jgi:hypothetical protein